MCWVKYHSRNDINNVHFSSGPEVDMKLQCSSQETQLFYTSPNNLHMTTDRHMTRDNHPPTPASHKLPLIPQAEILISKGPWSNSASPPASAHSSTISCTKCNGCQTRCRTHGLHGSPCTSCIHAKATMVDRWLATHGPSCSGKPRPWLVA